MTATKRTPDTSANLSPRTFGFGFVAGVVVTLLTLTILDSVEDVLTAYPTTVEDSRETPDDLVFTFEPILKSGEMPETAAHSHNKNTTREGADSQPLNVPD